MTAAALRELARAKGWPKHDHPGPDAAYECDSGVDPCLPATLAALADDVERLEAVREAAKPLLAAAEELNLAGGTHADRGWPDRERWFYASKAVWEATHTLRAALAAEGLSVTFDGTVGALRRVLFDATEYITSGRVAAEALRLYQDTASAAASERERIAGDERAAIRELIEGLVRVRPRGTEEVHPLGFYEAVQAILAVLDSRDRPAPGDPE